jgi:hypothetical protein
VTGDRNWTNLGNGQPETLLAAILWDGRGSQLPRPHHRRQIPNWRPPSAVAEDRNGLLDTGETFVFTTWRPPSTVAEDRNLNIGRELTYVIGGGHLSDGR